YSVTINPPLAITTSTLPNWTANVAGYSQNISATGGTGTFGYSSTGTLPPGLTLSTSGVLSGTPTNPGTYTFAVTATDDEQTPTYATLDDTSATPGNTFPQGVSGNNVVGYFVNGAGTHGFLYNGSTYTTLDDPSATPGNTYAEGIFGNSIVGYYANS